MEAVHFPTKMLIYTELLLAPSLLYHCIRNAAVDIFAQTCVKQDATGANDGGTPDSSSTLAVPGAAALCGGFNRTKTLLSERKPDLNETILSGDIKRGIYQIAVSNGGQVVGRAAFRL